MVKSIIKEIIIMETPINGIICNIKLVEKFNLNPKFFSYLLSNLYVFIITFLSSLWININCIISISVVIASNIKKNFNIASPSEISKNVNDIPNTKTIIICNK